MPERPSRWVQFLVGSSVGFLIGLLVKELDLLTLVSYRGESSELVPLAAVIGGVAWLTSLRKPVALIAAGLGTLWLAVAFTPITNTLAEPLVRRDPPVEADAVFVLGSGIQEDGELTTLAMSRLLHGLELLGEGLAPRLILSELPPPYPRYRRPACELMLSLGLQHEVLTVGPVRSTRDEAVAVGELFQEWGFERVIVVTSPSHSRRASAALETEGVRVVSSPATQTQFDYENLSRFMESDHHLRAIGPLIHEHAGWWYYRLRGWIRP